MCPKTIQGPFERRERGRPETVRGPKKTKISGDAWTPKAYVQFLAFKMKGKIIRDVDSSAVRDLRRPFGEKQRRENFADPEERGARGVVA